MAQLSSPGVSVSVINESFYTPSGIGTVPLVILASAENKQNSSNSGIAPATMKSNVNQVYLLTSQKDVSANYGTATFHTDSSGNPIHAGELNEYGIQALYSFLGVANRAYALRADIDLSQLNAQALPPVGLPANGTVWQDTVNTQYGIFEWDGVSKFVNKIPMVITDSTQVVVVIDPITHTSSIAPIPSVGAIGSYAIVSTTNLNTLWYKVFDQTVSPKVGTWVPVGSLSWASKFAAVTGSVASLSGSTAFTATVNISVNSTVHTSSGLTTITSLISWINGLSLGLTAYLDTNGKFNISTQSNTFTIYGSTTTTDLTVVGITHGTYNPPSLSIQPHTQIPSYTSSTLGGSIWVKTTSPNLGANWVINQYNSSTNTWSNIPVGLYPNNATALNKLDPNGGGLNLTTNMMYVKYNDAEVSPVNAVNFKVYRRTNSGVMTIQSKSIITTGTANVNQTLFTPTPNTYSFTISESIVGSNNYTSPTTISFTIDTSITGASNPATALTNLIVSSINNALPNSNIVASVNASNQVSITNNNGGDIKLTDGTNTPISKLFIAQDTNNPNKTITPTTNFYNDPDGTGYVATLWSSLTSDTFSSFIVPSSTAIVSDPADGQLWYDSYIEDVDIMYNTGTAWEGYLNKYQNTNPTGPMISYSAPTTQVDGTALVDNDLWICTADLENYPMIYRYVSLTQTWNLIDNTDSTTQNGIIFKDARWNVDGTSTGDSSIVGLLKSDFVDFDAPDPALYPNGMLLWNLRRSGFNVKQYKRNYVNVNGVNIRMNNATMSTYHADRWVSISPNQENGAGTFGRKAQRSVIVKAMTAAIETNQLIRDNEGKVFDLILAPGYTELMNAMTNLNIDRGQTACVIGDAPARLLPDSNSLYNWGTNQNGALNDGDNGLVTTNSDLGVFYSWGYTTDNYGNNIVVPPSHMMLKTIALSDQVSYKWFSFAGTRRGLITNATAVGYVDSNGEFQSTNLPESIRNTMASIQVNPITYINGSGICNFGQYTRDLSSSSTNRLNVSRLVEYLRYMLKIISKPYIEEPNDRITRNEIKQQIEKFLLELVAQRALNDFIVVCDTSNNTPTTIDRSELWVDIAIEPMKAVEFIYIPVRLENTGTIQNIANM